MKSYLENAFRVLGLPSNATRKTLRDAQQSLRTRLKAKGDINIQDPLTFLSPILRNENTIRESITILENPQSRLKERLFWFTNTNITDNAALNMLKNKDLASAIAEWDSDSQITSKANLASLYLLICEKNSNFDINLWEKTLRIWNDLLSSHAFWACFTNWELESSFEPIATNLDIKNFRLQSPMLVLTPLIKQLSESLTTKNVNLTQNYLGILRSSNFPINIVKQAELKALENSENEIKRNIDNIINSLEKTLSKEKLFLETKCKVCDRAYQNYKADLLPALNFFKEISDSNSEIYLRLTEQVAKFLKKLADSYLVECESFSTYEKIIKEALALVPETILAERIQQDLSSISEKRASKYLENGREHYDAGRYQEAVDAYREAVLIEPNCAETCLCLGLAYRKLGRYTEAIEAFNKAILNDPKLAEAHFNLGFLTSKLTKFSQALLYLQEAILLQPEMSEAHFHLGLAYQALDNSEEAILAYQQAISFTPNYPEAYYQLGIIFNKQRNFSESIKAFQQVLRLEPENNLAYYHLGLNYYQQSFFQDAAKAFQQAIRLKSGYAEAYHYLAMSYEKLQNYQEALASYQQAIRFKPGDVEIHFSLAEIHSILSQHNEAINCYKQVIFLNLNNWKAHFQLAMSYFHQENYASALNAFRQTLVYKPDHDQSYYQMGMIYEIQQRYSDALVNFQEAIKLSPNYLAAEESFIRVQSRLQETKNHSEQIYFSTNNKLTLESLFEKAANQSLSGDDKQAISTYREIIFQQPNHIKAHYNLAAILSKLARHQEAIEIYQKLTLLSPNEAKVFYNLGIAYAKAGQHSEALIAYYQAIRLENHYVEAHFALGVANSKLKKYKEAVDAYKQVLNLVPTHPGAYYNLGVAYRNLSRYLEALDNFKQALRHKPTADIHYNLGLVYEKLNRLQNARQEYKQALKLDPTHKQSQGNLKQVEKDLSHYQESFELNLPLVNVVLPSKTTANTEEKIQEKPPNVDLLSFKEKVINNSEDYMAHYNLGVAYNKTGQYEEAIKSYKQAVTLKIDFLAAYFALGVAYTKLQLYQEAIGAYKIVTSNNPSDINSHFNLATVYRQSKRYSEAVEAYKKLLVLQEDHSKAHYGLGLTYMLMDDYHLALQEYNTLKTLAPDLADELFKQMESN